LDHQPEVVVVDDISSELESRKKSSGSSFCIPRIRSVCLACGFALEKSENKPNRIWVIAKPALKHLDDTGALEKGNTSKILHKSGPPASIQ